MTMDESLPREPIFPSHPDPFHKRIQTPRASDVTMVTKTNRAMVPTKNLISTMGDAEEILKKAGLHLDELHRLRLLAPDGWETITGLSEQSKEFSSLLTAFNKSSETLIKTFEELAALVEAEKLRAMTLKNQLTTPDRAKSTESSQMQVLIRQKQVELERLRIELAAAQKVEAQQREFMQRFTAG